MNNDLLLVSVVIPTYGGPQFLQRCIEGALNQTYQNIEVIVVDDNGIGTPNQIATKDAISLYSNNSKVKYICHDVNKNGSAARNTGVRNASGEYIALLDDDDIFYPDKIERQVALLSTLPKEYAFVYCSHEVFLNGSLLRTVIAEASGSLFFEKLSKQIEIQTSGVLLRKSVFEEVGGFDESFRRHQDWEFIERIMSKYKIQADNFIGYKRELYFRSDSTSPAKTKEWRMHYLDKMSPYINALPAKQAKTVYFRNRLDVTMEFLKAKDIKGFVNEFVDAKLGLKGVCCVIKRVFESAKRGGAVR